jgi:hypothetical protein
VTTIAAPDLIPCPSCGSPCLHGYLGVLDQSDEIVPFIHAEDIVWTDGKVTRLKLEIHQPHVKLPAHSEFIARCAKCSAIFPDHFIPWRLDLESPAPDSRLIWDQQSSGQLEIDDHSAEISMATLEETLGYLEHLSGSSYYEEWTAIQQLIFLLIQDVRMGQEISGSIEKRARELLQAKVEFLSGALEGAFMPRTLLEPGSPRSQESLPLDWATFADMHRLAGSFDLADQYLSSARGSSDYQEDGQPKSFIDSEPIFDRASATKRVRIEILQRMISQKDSSWTASRRVMIEPDSQTVNRAGTNAPQQKVFTFYINDPDAETGVYGQVASTAEEVESTLQSKGYGDFFLFEERDLFPDEEPEAADFRIKLSPHLGPKWLSVVEAMSLVIEDKRSEFFRIQTLARKFAFDSSLSPYIQGLILTDGSFRVEAPKHFFEDGLLGHRKAEQLLFIGWNPPGETDETFNYWRDFEPGWNPRAISEFSLETLTTVFGFTEEDFFDLGPSWQPHSVWKQGNLYRAPIDEGNPSGSIFRIPDSENFEIAEFKYPEIPNSKIADPFEQEAAEPSTKERYRHVLAQLLLLFESLEIGRITERLHNAIRIEYNGTEFGGPDIAHELVALLEEIKFDNFSPNFISLASVLRQELSDLVSKFSVIPLAADGSARFNDLPNGLRKLILEMLERVTKSKGENGVLASAALTAFSSGVGSMKQSELQDELAKLLRLLVD